MSCYAGIDIGAVSATAALIVTSDSPLAGKAVAGFTELRTLDNGDRLLLSDYRRTRGKPIAAATALLEPIVTAFGAEAVRGVVLTGSGAKATAAKLESRQINEFRALATGMEVLGIEASTVFEVGGEASKYLHIQRNDDGGYDIVDYATNGDCAAGTGSFIDQQANRLQYTVEEIGELCNQADRAAAIAGRCSVFAKSDMIHAQQKGYNPAEVLRGLCNAVARNFRTAVVRSHPVIEPVAFVGGLTANSAVVRAMKEAFELDELTIPERAYAHVPAVGAAAIARRAGDESDLSHMSDLRASSDTEHSTFPTTEPLSMQDVTLLRDKAKDFEGHGEGRVDAYMGIDIGSVSTNVVVVDSQGRVIEEIYTRTQGRPIEVVSGALRQIESRWGGKLVIRGVGTTGSGRELVGELIGADTINDEITAHKTGATFVGQTLLDGRVPDTIFEIGGQDSKYISLSDGVVVDFTMNEACAAGTGSFLEERAEELDIAIKGEFAELALSSEAPIRLGERCTVFMERDVNSYMQRGADKADLVAGLAFSVVYNYINRVVRGRHIGETIFFQGGTAYNDAVAAAFSQVTGKEIIVPPHNGVMGAIGVALLARDKMQAVATNQPGQEISAYAREMARHEAQTASRFRGYDMEKVDYTLREFVCKGCSNACSIQEFTVEGEKTYWGDKCSDRFRKRVKSTKKPVIDDLMAFRHELLMDESNLKPVAESAPTVGLPLTMFAWEQLPFWRTLLNRLGCRVVLGDETNKKIITAGLDTVVAEPCFPIIVAHGHIANLIDKSLDHILLPNILSQETEWTHTEAHLCPWHQTMAFVIRRAPAFTAHAGKFLTPLTCFREGRSTVRRMLSEYFLGSPLAGRLNLSSRSVAQALDAAYAAQDAFAAAIRDKGAEAVETLRQSDEPGVVLLGRPYNVHDSGVNLSVAQKLREYYGVNVIPLDFLDTAGVDIRDINDSMFWDLGRTIIAAAKIVGDLPNLHIIHVTNFKCGPDSFIKHFIRTASHKPFLTLQFDGHSNDAGMMTRCEAYLDSKGILRPWRGKNQPAESLAGA